MKKVLAIDMGATSIRGIIGYIENDNLMTKEVMRMSHKIVSENGFMRWQFNELLEKIVDTICDNANDISSVGIDTWGVDFGILDENGKLIQNPISYREKTHEEGHSEAVSCMSEEEIFLKTGNQVMNINTLFQLISLRKNMPDSWNRVKTVLMMPDLFQYMFTGNMVGEETILSTSQCLDLANVSISDEVLSRMNIDSSIFPKLVRAGEKTGSTKTAKIDRLRDYDIDVISVCGHDTASAVMITQAFKDTNCMFLSCGTWSLIGGLVEKPIIDSKVYKKSLTNELGYDSSAMFFKNITGLYILEKYKEQLEKKLDRKIDFEEINEYLKTSTTDLITIDVENEKLALDDSDMKNVIDNLLNEKGYKSLENDMEYFKIIYESLAQKYLETKNSIEELSGKKYEKIHVIGGGAKSAYLCQLISDKLDLPVIAGPFEATALGNILVQLKAVGEIDNIQQGIELVKKSQKVNYYKPNK